MGYQMMPTVLIGLILFGTYSIYRNLIRTNAFLMALLSTTILFSIMPDITEGIYWYTGAWTYIPGGVLLLLGVSLLIKHQDDLKIKKLITPTLLFVIAAGFNEVIALLGIILFSCLLIFQRTRKIGIVFSALFILLLVYVLIAPGNDVRSTNFHDNHDLFYSLYMSVAYTVRFIGEWMLNPAFYLWVIVLFSLKIKTEFIDKLSFFKKPIIILVVLIIPTYIACFASIWSTGMLGQYRTANLSSFLFVISLSLILLTNKEYIRDKINLNVKSPILFGALLVSLVLWKNQFYLFTELGPGQLSDFDYEMNNRYVLLEECSGQCFVPRIENAPKTLFVYPLNADPNHWLNEAYAIYFGLEKVTLRTTKH